MGIRLMVGDVEDYEERSKTKNRCEDIESLSYFNDFIYMSYATI